MFELWSFFLNRCSKRFTSNYRCFGIVVSDLNYISQKGKTSNYRGRTVTKHHQGCANHRNCQVHSRLQDFFVGQVSALQNTELNSRKLQFVAIKRIKLIVDAVSLNIGFLEVKLKPHKTLMKLFVTGTQKDRGCFKANLTSFF